MNTPRRFFKEERKRIDLELNDIMFHDISRPALQDCRIPSFHSTVLRSLSRPTVDRTTAPPAKPPKPCRMNIGVFIGVLNV